MFERLEKLVGERVEKLVPERSNKWIIEQVYNIPIVFFVIALPVCVLAFWDIRNGVYNEWILVFVFAMPLLTIFQLYANFLKNKTDN
ncbi:MAG: hypothetical protein COB37_00875 [Kordiimonadales bacterium]|nr:MAG: hypothetical protein COB37_00875 [Kordiimonadales bacterium]